MVLYLLYPYAIDGDYIAGNGWLSYTNDTTPRPMYAIALTGMCCYFNAFSV